MSGSGTADNPLIVPPGPMGAMATGLQGRVQSVFTSKRFNFEFIPARMTLKEWNRLAGIAPFVGLGWKGAAARGEFESTFQAQAEWTLYLITKNANSPQARYLGDSLGLGQLAMVQSAIALLNGFTIPDVGGCYVKSAGNMWVDGWEADQCSLASIELSVGLAIDATDVLNFGAVPILETLTSTWEAPNGDVLIVDTDTMVVAENGY